MTSDVAATHSSLDAEQGTYNVRDMLGWKRDGTLDLRPKFQRDSVWHAKAKSFLIDSIVKGFPLPLFVLQLETRGGPTDIIRRVVDGQQRLRSIIAFIEPSLLDDHNESDVWLYHALTDSGPARKGQGFTDLDPKTQNLILATRLCVSSIPTEATVGEVLEIYDRLNSTGSPLTAQELRYAKRDGRFSDLCYRLARRNQSRWVGWRVFNDVEIGRMKDVEFTSELVLLLMNGIQKTGRKEIDAAYDAFQSEVPGEQQIEETFDRVMRSLGEAFANPPHRDPLKPFRARGWFYALFAWQARHVTPHDNDLTTALRLAAIRLQQDRKTKPELIRAISGSASDKQSRDNRYAYLSATLEAILR